MIAIGPAPSMAQKQDWPRGADGHLAMHTRALDLKALLHDAA